MSRRRILPCSAKSTCFLVRSRKRSIKTVPSVRTTRTRLCLNVAVWGLDRDFIGGSIREFSSCQWHEVLQRAVDPEPGKQSDGQVHHLNRFRHDQGAPPESREPVTKAAVDLLQSPSLLFALVRLSHRQGLIIANVAIRTLSSHHPSLQTLQQRIQGSL